MTDSSGQPSERSFWDKLSIVHLTRRALKRLSRQNKLQAVKPNGPEICPSSRALEPQDIKAFARHGGPDLTDLRGVLFSTFGPDCAC